MGLWGDIENTINTADCDNVLVAGDLNCHLARNTRFTSTIQNFFQDLNMQFLWKSDNDKVDTIDFTYLFSSGDQAAATSTIDHFVCKSSVIDSIVEAGVIHDTENISNHSPIFMKLVMNDININIQNNYSEKKASCAKSTADNKGNYKETVGNKLRRIKLPSCLDCVNLHCSHHSAEIEDNTACVLEAIEESAEMTLHSIGGGGDTKKPNRIAGWNEYIKPYYEKSKFLHSVWVSVGKPSTGGLYDIMRQTKAQYKYAFRRVSRARDKIQNDQFVNELLEGDINLFN